jgi:hypothetical protein
VTEAVFIASAKALTEVVAILALVDVVARIAVAKLASW